MLLSLPLLLSNLEINLFLFQHGLRHLQPTFKLLIVLVACL
jgi:hypothetical protein